MHNCGWLRSTRTHQVLRTSARGTAPAWRPNLDQRYSLINYRSMFGTLEDLSEATGRDASAFMEKREPNSVPRDLPVLICPTISDRALLSTAATADVQTYSSMGPVSGSLEPDVASSPPRCLKTLDSDQSLFFRKK